MSGVSQLPALLIVMPILAAAVSNASGLRFKRTGWPLALVVTSSLFVGTVYLSTEVYSTGAVSHNVGGFPREYGIELVADEFSMLVLLLISGASPGPGSIHGYFACVTRRYPTLNRIYRRVVHRYWSH